MKVMEPQMWCSRQYCSTLPRSGPSPSMSSRAGTVFCTRSKTAITSSTRLTGRKLEMWTSSRSPGLAQRRAPGSLRAASKRAGSMKLGMTSISLGMPSCSSVARRSDSETAVTASLFMIPQRVVSR